MDNIISPDELAEWKKAGRIAAAALKYAEKLIKPGENIEVVSDKIEEKIYAMGGIPAWPVQINLNHVAAHYAAVANDPIMFKDEVICIDVGVHVNGAIGDNALTVDLSGKYKDLVRASREAVNNAIKVMAPGVKVGLIGKIIEETIRSFGYQPVRNLSGHGIGRFKIHTAPGIPNFANNSSTELKEHMIIASEPFATDGKAGLIHEAQECQVFAQVSSKNPRSLYAREVFLAIKEYNGLPFTTRWLTKKFAQSKVNFALRELVKDGMIRTHSPLVEDSKGMVSQAEHTMYIAEKGAVVLTVADE